jgi:hypothetical protein
MMSRILAGLEIKYALWKPVLYQRIKDGVLLKYWRELSKCRIREGM